MDCALNEIENFLLWERASRDTIDVKRIYVDIAGNDLVAGVLLSQIIFWYLPSKDGASKMTIEKDGRLWLAKKREEWWEECRITPRQFDRASSLLESLHLITTQLFRHNGTPVVHISLNLHDLTETLKSILPKGESPFSPNVKMDFTKTLKSLREETTTETTTETTPEIKTKTIMGMSAEDLVQLYNELTPDDHPKIQTLSDARRKKAQRYLKQFPDRTFWETVFSEVGASPFLTGKVGSKNYPAKKRGFDWLLQVGHDNVENCLKVFEGKYRDKQGASSITEEARVAMIQRLQERNARSTEQLYGF